MLDLAVHLAGRGVLTRDGRQGVPRTMAQRYQSRRKLLLSACTMQLSAYPTIAFLDDGKRCTC